MNGSRVALPVGRRPGHALPRSSRSRTTSSWRPAGPAPPVRPLVEESWRRSLAQGMDPETSRAPVQLHRRLAGRPARRPPARDGHAGDPPAAGRGRGRRRPAGRRQRRRRAACSGSRASTACARRPPPCTSSRAPAGARRDAGTNAPGTALALDQPVQIFAAEHLSRLATSWSCSAAPIHDPDTGAVLGALDLTGGDEVAAPRALTLVRATVAAVEAELRLQRLRRPDRTPAQRRSASGSRCSAGTAACCTTRPA